MEQEFQLLNFTPQLYYHPMLSNEVNEKKPEPIASSILLLIGTGHFLITAKHVFNEININDVIILSTNENSSVRLYGKMGYFIINGRHDNLDIAILKLSIEHAELLTKTYSFLHYANIDFSHNFSSENNYMLLGFIHHQTRLKEKYFSPVPFGFLTNTKSLKKIDKFGLNERDNITLKYNRRNQGYLYDKFPSFGPKDLSGLSGGGIWHCKKDKSNPNLQHCSLVGIMTEQLHGRGIIVGTKIALALQIFYSYFNIKL